MTGAKITSGARHWNYSTLSNPMGKAYLSTTERSYCPFRRFRISVPRACTAHHGEFAHVVFAVHRIAQFHTLIRPRVKTSAHHVGNLSELSAAAKGPTKLMYQDSNAVHLPILPLLRLTNSILCAATDKTYMNCYLKHTLFVYFRRDSRLQ